MVAMTDKTPVPACPACGGYRERPTGDAALRCACQDKTPPIEIPTADELNAADVSCGTCDRAERLPANNLKCGYYNASTPDSGFCHKHPKLRGEG